MLAQAGIQANYIEDGFPLKAAGMTEKDEAG
jgi:hypothetical protein